MSLCYRDKILIQRNQLNLDLTLLGGQSFRWEKIEQNPSKPEWRGVAFDAFWILTQNSEAVTYKVYPVPCKSACDAEYFKTLIKQYFRVEFDLPTNVNQWKLAHKHFVEIASNMNAVRVLDQEPLENILSFICSQNNNIKRITNMIRWLCSTYGKKIGNFNGIDEYTFPSLDTLAKHNDKLETSLREAKFGYRAKFISQAINEIIQYGGEEWFAKLRDLPYLEARSQLVTLHGIGMKVADCVCLMSLNHLEAVPIDTHIFKIAQVSYMPHLGKNKSVTPKLYDEISSHFRSVYGQYAGWAQAILFCSDLQQFQTGKKAYKNMSNNRNEIEGNK